MQQTRALCSSRNGQTTFGAEASVIGDAQVGTSEAVDWFPRNAKGQRPFEEGMPESDAAGRGAAGQRTAGRSKGGQMLQAEQVRTGQTALPEISFDEEDSPQRQGLCRRQAVFAKAVRSTDRC